MAKFIIRSVTPITNKERKFIYDNQTSQIFDETGEQLKFGTASLRDNNTVFATSQLTPAGKTKDIKKLKIQLGLACNYECSYCSQRYVPRAEETNVNDVEPFLTTLGSWFNPTDDVRVEFWGGEPFVYWKTLKPLAEGIRAQYPTATLAMVTNGTLLDLEKNAWLDDLGFSIGISHDGPGYHARGLDPFDNPEQFAMILDLWHRLGPKGRLSFNAMVHKDNLSRAAIVDWFKDRLGFDVPIGEGGFIDPYDEGGAGVCMTEPADHIAYRTNSFAELRQGKGITIDAASRKIDDFIQSVVTQRPAGNLGQKCGMDRSDNIAVDLKGQVLTCQNVSAVATSFNGASHLIGHVTDFDNIKLTTSTHWSHRAECPNCPVLQLCHGSCMFLAGDMWELACDNAYSDNIPFFMSAWEILTGTIPYYIDGPQADARKDIIGAVNGVPKKKVIPILSV